LPTSCISFRNNFFREFIKKIKNKSFPNLEIDARLIIYAYHYKKDFNILFKRLTYYVKSLNSISSNYSKFSKNWWFKRKEAFDYLQIVNNTKKFNFFKSIDYSLTVVIYYFFIFLKKNKYL